VVLDETKSYVCYDNFLTSEEVAALRACSEPAGSPSTLNAECKVDVTYRRSLSSPVVFCDETRWFFDKLENFVTFANVDHFKFDVTGFENNCEILTYANVGDHVDWHMDRGFGSPVRKLSVVVQLSESDEYCGGNLELMTSKDPVVMSRSKGSLIIFPSFVLHRVTPIICGVRESLVCWVTGPLLR
jgi:PKHD-type hydroxylase